MFATHPIVVPRKTTVDVVDGGVKVLADGQFELVHALLENDLCRERLDPVNEELAHVPRHDQRSAVDNPQARDHRVVVDPHGAPRLQRDRVGGVVQRQDGDRALNDGLRPEHLADRHLPRSRDDQSLDGAGVRLNHNDGEGCS